jgi:flagellar biosynthesis protein FlhB
MNELEFIKIILKFTFAFLIVFYFYENVKVMLNIDDNLGYKIRIQKWICYISFIIILCLINFIDIKQL